ncbi:hypothetical protein EMIHUDRAFT_45174, partial [Emiliania huxleyi CCMP1516]|uniref:Xrn1 N-terminal domain-containing protein n=2 Tax=Emiliania huxleyi TaxID=2903 RepID=A0A0D3J3I8_EMIH1
MGVPGLFSWVRRQFPEAIIPEEVWSKSSPAPVSSLFVDLNHILHACTHPEYPYEEPSSREAMLEAILLYIEALLALVQPTDLLFIAVDGPPPRAKMNQQRSRRFLAAMEAADRKRMQEQARTALASLLGFDSNLLTPGTRLMDLMAWMCASIEAALRERLAGGGPLWRGLAVLFSSASEPGEGEHKLMHYVR